MENTKNPPLNLKYVSDIIKDEHTKWRPGDIVVINSQTGTGKTFFITGSKEKNGLIDTLDEHEKLLYLCNRTALKRQIKIDLIKKSGTIVPIKHNDQGQVILDNQNKPTVDFEAVDANTHIENCVVSSYHTVAATELDIRYRNEGGFDLDAYKFIVCDEIQFVLSDSGFMTKTLLVFEQIIRKQHPNSILIYISATMDEMLPLIKKGFESNQKKDWTPEPNKLWEYSTGTDYSYLDIKYFFKEKDIVNLIANDQTDEKWLVFVSSSKIGQTMQSSLSEFGIESVFVKSGSDSKEVENIVNSSSFDCKVLISTKFLDNGVNLQDEKVTNLVVAANDKNTFIQEIGRLRIDIKNPRKVNLYIKASGKKAFDERIKKTYKPKLDCIASFEKDKNKFRADYNMSLNKVAPDIFFLDKDNQWNINSMGYARLLKDHALACEMVASFRYEKYTYIKKQLQWLNRESDFSESNIVSDVVINEDIKPLNNFLQDAYEDDNCCKDVFRERIMQIISESKTLTILLNKLDGRNNRPKGVACFNKLIEQCDLPYIVTGKQKRIDGKKTTVWIVGKNDE